MFNDIHVLKIGGSLLDLPDLSQRVAIVLAALRQQRIAIVVGGAEAADVVRRFDAMHHLKETTSHWLAVRAMQLNAYLVAQVIEGVDIATNADACARIWSAGRQAIIDPLFWLEQDERDGITIAHRWTFTSDSIAAHVASRMKAGRLTLLKSILPEHRADVKEAMASGIVDADFEAASQQIPSIDIINLRHESLTSGRIDAAARCSLRCQMQ